MTLEHAKAILRWYEFPHDPDKVMAAGVSTAALIDWGETCEEYGEIFVKWAATKPYNEVNETNFLRRNSQNVTLIVTVSAPKDRDIDDVAALVQARFNLLAPGDGLSIIKSQPLEE